MKETPIIFSTELIPKVLDGTKTQTRRVIKMHAIMLPPNPTTETINLYKELAIRWCPYGQVGDRLIIKEAWAVDKLWDAKKPSEISNLATLWYPADGQIKPMWVGRTRSSRFMCKWMSRAKLEITEVRAERVQEITPRDCEAEGIYGRNMLDVYIKMDFIHLWDSLNASRGYGWDDNPWVYRLSFKVVTRRVK